MIASTIRRVSDGSRAYRVSKSGGTSYGDLTKQTAPQDSYENFLAMGFHQLSEDPTGTNDPGAGKTPE